MQDSLKHIFHVNYDLISPDVVQSPEDYKALLYMMRENADPEYARVQEILTTHQGDRVRQKLALQQEQRGVLWRRLLKDYFPKIRYARVLLYFEPDDYGSLAHHPHGDSGSEPLPGQLTGPTEVSQEIVMPVAVSAISESSQAVVMPADSFSYARVIKDTHGKSKIQVPDSVFYESSKGVIFPVNKYFLPKGNSWIKELSEEVKPWSLSNNLELRHVEMRGASSPEGPLKWNDFLARERSQALQDTLQHIFNVDYSLVDSAVVENPEDYKALLYMMRCKNDPDYAYVQGVLNRYAGDRYNQKEALKKAFGGALWKRLLREYFPDIRYARVLLYFAPRESAYGLPDGYLRYFPPMGIEPREVNLKGELQPVYFVNSFRPEDTGNFFARYPRRHLLALRTNLVYDGLYMPRYGWAPSPNIAVEYFPKKGRFTFNFELTYPDWEGFENQHFWQIHDYQFAIRCYTRRHKVAPRDAREYGDLVADYFQGLYVGAYVNGGRYGIGFNKEDGWEGEHAGAGLQLGYTVPLSRSSRWRLEFSASAGWLTTKYDPYIYGNPISGEEDGFYYYDWHHSADLFIKRNHRLNWLGPTGAGIHLTYDLLYRRSPKKGISFKRWEKGGAR